MTVLWIGLIWVWLFTIAMAIRIIFVFNQQNKQIETLTEKVDITRDALGRLWETNSKVAKHTDQIISINGNLNAINPKLYELEKEIIKLKNERVKSGSKKWKVKA